MKNLINAIFLILMGILLLMSCKTDDKLLLRPPTDRVQYFPHWEFNAHEITTEFFITNLSKESDSLCLKFIKEDGGDFEMQPLIVHRNCQEPVRTTTDEAGKFCFRLEAKYTIAIRLDRENSRLQCGFGFAKLTRQGLNNLKRMKFLAWGAVDAYVFGDKITRAPVSIIINGGNPFYLASKRINIKKMN